LNHSTTFGIRIASFDLHRSNAGNARDEISEEAVAFSFGFDGRHGSGSQLSGVLSSDFPGTDHRCRYYRGFSESFKRAFAPSNALEDTRGYVLAGFVGSQLVRESFTRPVESDFHIGDGSFVKVIGNHFNVLRQLILQDFARRRLG
jgi:hypothetical protein